MMHITTTSFHINVHANKSYLLNVDPLETLLAPEIQNPRKYTVRRYKFTTDIDIGYDMISVAVRLMLAGA